MKRNIFERLGLAILALAMGHCANACGPDFPNSFLAGGDHAMLLAPVAGFYEALDRIKVPPSGFHAHPAKDVLAQSAEADVADLRLALVKSTLPAREKEKLVKEYQAERQKLLDYAQAVKASEEGESWGWENGEYKQKEKRPVPELEEAKVVAGLPAEFADYLRAGVAFRKGRIEEARTLWRALLERPKNERHYRSVWAAYMLGRTSETNDSAGELNYYTQVRALAKQGFSDSLGLAAASLGWEAKIHLEQKEFEPAIELYLQQYAAGDGSAAVSLRWTAAAAFHEGIEALEPLAKNPRTRQIITAYVIDQVADGTESNEPHGVVRAWLEAMEAGGVRDAESATQLALAAYQNGQMATAQRWINRAPGSPTAQWLQAKLLLRAGKIDEAAALLARVAPAFPLNLTKTNAAAPATFEESLGVPGVTGYADRGREARRSRFGLFSPADSGYAVSELDREGNPGDRILGELGVLHLERREYRQSLDCLLRSGYWMDAAYVAERVLTVDELKEYVDQEWPPAVRPKPAADGVSPTEQLGSSFEPRQEIRYLLGRKLTRLSRGVEARDYFPLEIQPRLDELLQTLDEGYDTASPTNQRAQTLFQAAKILRASGLKLVGTEVSPDWSIHGGLFDEGLTTADRTNETAQITRASGDELSRYAANGTDPDMRFHYRYQAAFTAWEAAKLMPNNSDETAKVLWTAGCWLKAQDPETADVFYKSLVRRCRKTALGEEADRIRWFPELDEQGVIIPGKTRRKTKGETPSPTPEPVPVPVEEIPPEQ